MERSATCARGAWTFAAALTLSLCGMPARSQGTPDRIVFVNGELLGAAALEFVDRLNCGSPVPDGNYWLDLDNGLWGVVGVAGQNPLPDCSGGQQQQAPAEEESDCERKYRVHEDRMCYCYGVC